LFTDPTVAAVICESEGAVIAVALTKGNWKVIFGPILPPSEKALEKLGKKDACFISWPCLRAIPRSFTKKFRTTSRTCSSFGR